MFRKKQIVLNAYTCRDDVMEYSQLRQSSLAKPSWWKGLRRARDWEISNMRSCSGFNDLYKQSIALPMWCDVMLICGPVSNPFWRYKFSDEMSIAQSDDWLEQDDWLSAEQHQHFKLLSPWLLTCDEDVKFMFSDACYDRSSNFDYVVPSGVIEFKHQASLNVNMIARRHQSSETEIFVPFGKPVAHLTPLTERPVKVVHHLVSDEDFRKFYLARNSGLTFQNTYYKRKKLKGSGQCPFSK